MPLLHSQLDFSQSENVDLAPTIPVAIIVMLRVQRLVPTPAQKLIPFALQQAVDPTLYLFQQVLPQRTFLLCPFRTLLGTFEFSGNIQHGGYPPE